MKDLLVAVVSLIAIFTDAKWRKIPNWLTFPAIAVGLIFNCLEGWNGLFRSAGGLVASLAIMLPFFALDFLKAGDVKLVVAWGTIKGLGQPLGQFFALWAFLYGALIGGLMALIVLATEKASSERQGRLIAMLKLMLASPKTAAYFAGSSPLKKPMPYGVALGLAAILTLILERWLGSPCPFLSN